MECDFSCEKMSRYSVDLPYPEVIIDCKNIHYARLISGAYAGRGSEMTAITQYTFHNFFTSEYPDVATALKYISIVEMDHLRMLGELIRRLGLIPKYISCETGGYWNGTYPDYHTQIACMLEADIQGEREAIAHYKRLISQIGSESINKLLRRIIMDEEKHIEVLTPLYEKYR